MGLEGLTGQVLRAGIAIPAAMTELKTGDRDRNLWRSRSQPKVSPSITLKVRNDATKTSRNTCRASETPCRCCEAINLDLF
jgi:hypothetical protein